MTKSNILAFALGAVATGLTSYYYTLNAQPASPGFTGAHYDQPMERFKRVITEDKSRIALMLNKDFSASVATLNTGEKIPACNIDMSAYKNRPGAARRACYPKGHNPDGKILFKDTYDVTVREGSVCIELASSLHIYVFCDPPLDLGF